MILLLDSQLLAISCLVFQDINKSKDLQQNAKAELDGLKHESHKRKKIIATQQRIMQIGKDAYNKVGVIWI